MTTTGSERLEADLAAAKAKAEKERLRLRRILLFVNKTDDLDTAIYIILECWLGIPASV